MDWKAVEGEEEGCPVITLPRRNRGSSENKIWVKSVAVDVSRRENKSYKWKDFKVKVSNDAESSVCPLYREYNSVNFLVVHFSPTAPFEAVIKFLKNGVKLRYGDRSPEEIFVFFGHSANQIRERTCVLYNEKQGSVTDVLSHFGQFERIANIAKRAARIGLLFSTAAPGCRIPDDQISIVPDIERSKYIFTDGCGFISTECAEKVTKELNLQTLYKDIKSAEIPSVFQIRLKGCKGVLCHNPSVDRGIQIRPSMEKFIWNLKGPHLLGIVDKGFSRPNQFGSLNKQYIMLLSALGISDEVFLRKQEQYFKELQEITTKQEIAVKFLCANDEFELAEKLLKTGKLDAKTQKRLEQLRNRVREPQQSKANPLQKMRKSTVMKLRIPIEKSRNVYGVCDPSGKLKPKTVFFQPTIRGVPTILNDTRVVIAKNPCYHPGDIRVLRCVDVPECRHLVDCIVFPTEGSRPHSDEIAGSDLDGDKYFVCWDDELVPEREEQPCQYPGATSPKRLNPTGKEFLEYFAKYSNAVVSKLDALFDRWADTEGIHSKECKIVAALFSRAIDAAKTGERVNIPGYILQAPAKNDSDDKFVWLKLYQRAKLFESDQTAEAVVNGKVDDFDEEDMLAVISNQESRLSEYRLFRYLYKWCQQPNTERDIYRYIHLIDFTKFTQDQRKLLPADIPNADLEILLDPLRRSNILSKLDIDTFKLERSKERRWCLMYRAEVGEMSWRVLHNVLNSPLEKLIIFKFLLGDIPWVISLAITVSLNSSEVLTLVDEDHAAQAFASVHVQTEERHVLQLKRGYSFALEGKRLDIYTGKKQNTFICLKEDEKERVPIMSVALDRFSSSLPRKFQTRLRKEQFLEMEVFCVCNQSYPGQKIRTIAQKDPVCSQSDAFAAEEESNRQVQNEFVPDKNDFPSIGCDPEEMLSDIERNISCLYSHLENGLLQSRHLDEMCDKMTSLPDQKEKHQIACHLESFLWRSSSTIVLQTPDHYKYLVICLLGGLQELNFDVVLGGKVCITHLARVKRCLESLWKREVTFSVDQMFEIIDGVLLGNDYHIGCRIVDIISQGQLPLEGFASHPNALPYFLHWISLTALESLEEIKQAVVASHGAVPRDRVIAEATPCTNQESTFTLVITAGSHSYRPADGVALSRTDTSKREYIGEVTAINGIILTVNIVWPTNADDTSKENILKGKWYLYKFPSLVGYRRIVEALRTLQSPTSWGESLFEGIIGSFCVSNQSSPDTPECSDNDRSLENGSSAVKKDEDDGAFSSEDSQTKWCSANNSQIAAVQHATRSSSAISLIQGPPGSGKTITCAEIVKRWLLSSDDNVLLAAETNEGVDNLLKKLLEHGIQEEKIVRFGSSGWKVAKDMEHLTFEFKYRQQVRDKHDPNRINKKLAKRILTGCQILCTTCISAGSSLLEGIVYKRVLIDEASQATEPAILVPLSHGCEKLVLVGDDQQLPPMVLCELAKGPGLLTTSLFSRLRKVGFPVRMLNVQYRMHPSIACFPSREFYDGRLNNGVSEDARKSPKGFNWPNRNKPVVFLKTPDSARENSRASSKLNDFEAKEVYKVVGDLLQEGDVYQQGLGVITPYKAQLELIADKIKEFDKVSVRTVDGFQGQERDVIVFSAVRCNEHGFVGFLDDEKRMNVLLTRARRGIIVIGNKTTLQQCSLWKKWIEWVEENKLTCECTQDEATESPRPVDGSLGRRGRGRGLDSRGASHRGPRGRGRRRGTRDEARTMR